MIAITKGRLRSKLAEGTLMTTPSDFATYSSAQAFAYLNDKCRPAGLIR